MIKNLSLAILFVMVLFGCNGGTDDEDYYPPPHEEIPCLDVFESYYNPCVEECAKYCGGIQCLYCWADCSYEAKERAQQCCIDRYGGEQYEECMWYWSSSMSFSEYVVSMEELKLQEECGCEGEPSPTNP